MTKTSLMLVSLIFFIFTITMGEESGNLRGPLVDAATSPFIILYSKPDDKSSASAIESVVETFRKELSPEASQFSKLCKVEAELDQSDIENYNILLITIFRYSSLIKRVKDKIPLKIEDDIVSIGRREYKGDVGLIFICPNPLNPAKYLLVFGATNGRDPSTHHGFR
ncbi:hypothetical protein H5T87_09800 [bacterium]|nr:hypothetical protein [bacterium]